MELFGKLLSLVLYALRFICVISLIGFGVALASGFLVLQILPVVYEIGGPAYLQFNKDLDNASVKQSEIRSSESAPLIVYDPNSPAFKLSDFSPEEKRYDPSSSVIFALGDLLATNIIDRPFIRYLSLYNIPKKDRKALGQSLSYVINSFSKHKKPWIPEFVGASDETVVRINLRHYIIDPKAWDKLALEGSGVKPYPEPYFNLAKFEIEVGQEDRVTKVLKKIPTGKLKTDGTPEVKEQEVEVIEKVPVDKKVIKTKIETAPWLDALSITALKQESHTEFPVFRADWFIANVVVPPAYYNFLAVGDTLKDFEALVFANTAQSEKARSQVKAVVVKSSVARNNRTLTRSSTLNAPYNYYWRSHDTLASRGDRDYPKNPLDEKFDATEDIATLPNGLQAYFLSNQEGKRQDAAPTDIAIDSTAVDKTVRPGRSCMICHAEGIRPINDYIRLTTKFNPFKGNISIGTNDAERHERMNDLFDSDLDRQIAMDQSSYAYAVGLVTGLDPIANAKQLARFYNAYAENLLTKEIIAHEVGLTEKELDTIIRGVVVKDEKGKEVTIKSTDNNILNLIELPVKPIIREQWEQSFQGFMLMLKDIREKQASSSVEKKE